MSDQYPLNLLILNFLFPTPIPFRLSEGFKVLVIEVVSDHSSTPLTVGKRTGREQPGQWKVPYDVPRGRYRDSPTPRLVPRLYCLCAREVLGYQVLGRGEGRDRGRRGVSGRSSVPPGQRVCGASSVCRRRCASRSGVP